MDRLFIGIDIGGTTIKFGFIKNNGEIHSKWEIPTNGTYPASIASQIWDEIVRKSRQLNLNQEMFLGIGVGAPGFVEVNSGIIYEAVNIGWHEYNLKKELETLSGLPVYVQNDANLAALGENWVGEGNQASHLIAITLGTGVGSGVIIDGSILNGVKGIAGEIGHFKVEPNGAKCNCGGRGCLETICSATGIVRQAMEQITNHPHCILAKTYDKKGRLTAKDIFDLAKSGDLISKKIVEKTTDFLGMAIANIALVISPSTILIGGGVANAGDYLLQNIRSGFEKYALPKIKECCNIKLAKLGNDAGIVGGAYHVKQMLED